jgi:hypothetical protein
MANSSQKRFIQYSTATGFAQPFALALATPPAALFPGQPAWQVQGSQYMSYTQTIASLASGATGTVSFQFPLTALPNPLTLPSNTSGLILVNAGLTGPPPANLTVSPPILSSSINTFTLLGGVTYATPIITVAFQATASAALTGISLSFYAWATLHTSQTS